MSLKLERVIRRIADFELEAGFEVPRGTVAGLSGRSGSGKTSLLRLIAGLDPVDSGSILLEGVNLTHVPTHRRGVGLVFQDQALFPSMNVVENAAFALAAGGVSRLEREKVALEWLKRVRLAERASASIHTLSGGERQRLALARAFVSKPRALLLDEPFASLDASARDEMRRELLDLHREWPVPMIIVSHDESELGSLASLRLEIEIRGRQRAVTLRNS